MRRLDHRLRSKFSRAPRYDPSSIKTAFSASSLQTPQAVISHFVNRSEPVYLWNDADLPRLKMLATTEMREEIELLKTKAEKIRAGVFPLVSDVEFSFSGRVRWQFSFDDVEHLFFLNRWYHGITLAKAYFYIGDEGYVETFATLLENWIDDNPVNPASPAWESYSVTERIVNWIFAYHLLIRSNTFQERALVLLLSALASHARYLSEHLELKENHNHLINNARALFEVGVVFPEFDGADEFEETGWRILTRELKRQFLSDGMLGEQSVHYHLLLARTYLEVAIVAQKNGRRIESEFREQLERMLQCADAFVRPDGSIPLIGDFSPDTNLSSLIGIISAAAARFKINMGHRLTEAGLWYSDLSRNDAPHREGKDELLHLDGSGYAIVRTPNLHITFGCDPRGRVIRHGHADVLGLNVWYRGHDILADGGNYSYSKRRWDQYFRGPYAHSTVVIDGLPPYILPGYQQVLLPAEYSRASAQLETPVNQNGLFYFEGRHSGYERLAQPASVRRQVWIAAEDWIFIRDSISGKGERRVEVVYNLGASEFENEFICSKSGEKLAVIQTRCDRPFELRRWHGEDGDEIRGWISPSYAIKQPATSLSYEMKTSGDLTFETLIWLRLDAEVVWPELPAMTN